MSTVFIFDLDGALVDSVYQPVLAWKEALDAERIEAQAGRNCEASLRERMTA
jgi:beta-phosphoglucomutase-like phosphatase (HAD superfamily)